MSTGAPRAGSPANRWTQVAGATSGERYAARFAELAESGTDIHGEARFCAALLPDGGRVLDAGCGTGRVAGWLAEHGYDCVGVDADASMLAQARASFPAVRWLHTDLAQWDASAAGESAPFDLVVAAGNVIPLLGPGTEPAVLRKLAACLRPGGLLVAGFGLDAAHLPLEQAPVTLADYDGWCAAAELSLDRRFATWDGDPYRGGGYAVTISRS